MSTKENSKKSFHPIAFIKSFLKDFRPFVGMKPWMIIGITVFIVSMAIGNILDSKGFAVNIYATISGFFLGTIFFDYYIEKQEAERWKPVRIFTLQDLMNEIEVATFDLVTLLRKKFPDKCTFEFCDSLTDFMFHIHINKQAESISNLLEELNCEDIEFEGQEKIKEHFDNIVKSILPRLIQCHAGGDLITWIVFHNNTVTTIANEHDHRILNAITFHALLKLMDAADEEWKKLY